MIFVRENILNQIYNDELNREKVRAFDRVF